MKELQSFTITYKGNKGKGYAEVDRIIKATSKTEAKRLLLDEIPSASIKEIEPLIRKRK